MNEEIEKIRMRCIECGDCWLWQGACEAGSTPVMRAHGKKLVRVRRHVLSLMGVMLKKNFLAVSTCAESRCVAPDHAEAWTRKRLQTRTASLTRYGASSIRRAKIADACRARSKVTPEIVEFIRSDERSGRALALALGLSQSTVADIRAGNTWRDYSNPFMALVR